MARLSRADLVRLLGGHGADLSTQAAALGFDHHPRTAPPKRSLKRPAEQVRSPVNPAPDTDVEATAILWRVAHLETRAESTEKPPQVAVPEVLKRRANPRAVPIGPLAAPWAELWPRIYALICDDQRARTVDVPAVTEHIGRGRPLMRVPRERRLAWPTRVLILEDRRASMMPMARDVAEVARRLKRMLGEERVMVRKMRPRAQTRDQVMHLVRAIGPDTQVLALTDLGTTDRSAEFWRSLGAALGRAGVSAGALVPGHRGESHPAWKVRGWTDSTARGPVDEQVERLLALSMISRWTQPGLLRALRQCLPVHQADLGTELAIWRASQLRRAAMDGFVIERNAARRYRAAWTDFPAETRRDAWECVLDWHRNLPAELRSAEALAHAHMEPSAELSTADREFIAAFAGALRATVADDASLRGMLRRYGRALLGDLPDSVYADDALGAVLQAAWAEAFAGVEIEPPAAIAPEVFQNRVGAPARPVVLRQQGGRLTTSQSDRGSTIATLMTSEQVWRVTTQKKRTQQAIAQSIPLAGRTSITIETDRSTLVLECIDQPGWAVAIGRDRDGAFADVLIDGARYRLRWQTGTGWIGPGGLGADTVGVFEDVRIADIPVRFRLIRAGTFIMGSPGDEEGRYDDEGPQHEVNLTEPFWLAEAPVTQALWQAVTGKNPASFKGADRPVERVSWDDVMQFIDKAEQNHPGLALRLPTEAQWEYACRAGSTTPRYGELDAVAWHGGNSGGETHPVKQKQANAWGLYDMLGNVYEWTADRAYRSYQPGAVTNPTGPEEGSYRVVRGGSWGHSARSVRAAFRGGDPPGYRFGYLGFRLSRGPAPSARSAERAEPASEQRSEPPARSDGAEGQARSAGGGASPEGSRPSETPQTKRSIFSRIFGRKKDES